MKTNQTLLVSFFGHTIKAEHKLELVSLTDVFRVGNVVRVNNGHSVANITDYLNATRTQAFTRASADAWNVDPEKMVQVIGKGNKRQTMVHISVAIHAAEYLSPQFHAEVIKEFIQGRLFEYRDGSGDKFLALNMAVDTLPDRQETNNLGIYIQCAKKIKAKLLEEGQTWNTATAHQLRLRMDIENFCVTAIDTGFITDYRQLWTAIDKYRV